VRAILDYSEQLAADNAQLQPFVNTVQQLVRRFDIEQLKTLLIQLHPALDSSSSDDHS
jgi:hypothetical protein